MRETIEYSVGEWVRRRRKTSGSCMHRNQDQVTMYRVEYLGSVCLPVELILDYRRTATTLRAARLDARHPIHRRITRKRSFPVNTRLLRGQLPWPGGVEQVDPITVPPWVPPKLLALKLQKHTSKENTVFSFRR